MFHRRLVIAVLLTAVGTTSLRGQRINEIEPNDSLPTAQVVSLGEQVDAVLGVGDQDWFQFVVTTPTAVRLFTSPLGPVAVDTVLTLFDVAGIVVATNDDQRGVHSDISMRLAPGTYLVQVTGTGVLPTGDYSLDLGRIPSVPPPLVEAPEPNDSIQAATLEDEMTIVIGRFEPNRSQPFANPAFDHHPLLGVQLDAHRIADKRYDAAKIGVVQSIHVRSKKCGGHCNARS